MKHTHSHKDETPIETPNGTTTNKEEHIMYSKQMINQLNEAIQQFPQVSPITSDMVTTREGVARLVMLDRYSFKDLELKTLSVGDLVMLTVKDDSQFPERGIGIVTSIDEDERKVVIEVEEEFRGSLEGESHVTRKFDQIEKPLELFFEQIAERNARGLAAVESEEKRAEVQARFEKILKNGNTIPAGRVLYGAGAGIDVTYFNCYVLPFIRDSRGGISDHRKEAMEIMSRGGGVGTNGSTLRPKHALARTVNGKSSGSVSWLHDLSQLTHLVEQGGSRRGMYI